MIEAQTPDGASHQFPDGTPPEVVDKAIQSYVAEHPQPKAAAGGGEYGYAAAPPEPEKPPPPSLHARPTPEGAAAAAQNRAAVGEAVGRVGSAALQGFQAPALLTPEQQAANERANQQTWVGRNVVQPLVSASELPFRALNALGGALGQGAYEAGAAVSPRLGRDLYMLNQLAPAILPESGPPRVRGVQEAPPTPRFVQEHFGEGTRENPLAAQPQMPPPADIPPDAPRPAAVPINEPPPGAPPPGPAPSFVPPEPQPATPEGVPIPPEARGAPEPPPAAAPPEAAPAPQAAGAQITPSSELGLSPKEEIAYRATAEGNKLLEPQTPGVRDENQYLPGATAHEAELSQDVQTARELKSLRQQTPELDAKMAADETNNQNIVTNSIHNALPGRVQITAAEEARTQAMKTNEPRVFDNAADADVQPIVESIQQTLDEPKNRQNTQLGQYVRPLIARLVNEDGTPKITDPRELWGLRQDVQHLTSKAAQAGDPNLSRVSGLLGGILETIDNQIEAAAPGYKAQLRDEYRTRSQQIDAMRALDEERFKLFDSQNKPSYNAVQKFMRRIVDGRQRGDPYDPYANIPEDTLAKLWNIRDFMRRQVAADRLAAPKGSPTAQNIGDAVRAAGRMAVQSAAPLAGATLGAALIPIPGVGPAAGLIAGTAVNHLFSARAAAQRLARGLELTDTNRLLRPPEEPTPAPPTPPRPPPAPPSSAPPTAGPPPAPPRPPPAPPAPAGQGAFPLPQAAPEAAPAPQAPVGAVTEPPPAPPAPTAAEPPPAPAPNRTEPRAPSAGGIEALDPSQIGVDANRFQFKAGGNEAGVTERLQDVQRWDERLAGTALVFRDEAGKDWIADGHQRLALAQRLSAGGQPDVRLNAFVLNAADGVTDAQARAIAAAKNIAEGSGSSIDAAKVLREAAASGTDLPPLPPRSVLVREGQALARLGPDAFGMAVNEVVPTSQAALVGRIIADPKQQTEAMRVLAKVKPENLRQAEIIVREVASTAEDMTQQGGLFGEESFASSVVLERATLIDEAMKQLARDKTTFRTLVTEAERIQGHGENVLDPQANRSRLTADEQSAQFLTQLATRKGAVSDELTALARQLKAGDISRAAGARSFLGIVRQSVAGGLAEGDNAGGAVTGAASGGEAPLTTQRNQLL